MAELGLRRQGKKTRWARRRGPAFVAVALLLLGLLLAQSASAAVKCRYKNSTHVLSVTGGGGTFILVRRAGTAIEVSKGNGQRVSCHGSPTVTNTDHINAFYDGYGLLSISLSGGPFSPGATPEADSSSEIEITLRGFGEIHIEGGPGPDHFSYVNSRRGSGLKLNASPTDEDIDYLIPEETEFWVEGGPGPDVIEVLDHVSVDVTADGGPGNDTLIGGNGGGLIGGTLLEGGRGRDRIVGSPAFDLLAPGPGADLVEAMGGSDEIDMSPDKSKDRIDCGGGRDRVFSLEHPHGIAIDRLDQLRSCERVKGRR